MRKLTSMVAPFAVAALCACASSGATPAAVRTSSPDYITSVEVDASGVANAYDLVNRLRPRWLQSNGTSSIGGGSVRSLVIAVVLDGSRIGGLETLQTISTSGIKSVRYYDATRAATVLRDPGSDPIAGAIVITTTRSQ